MNFYAYHGVLPQETKVGNRFVVSVTLDAEVDAAMCTDALEDTINYAQVYALVAAEMAVPSKLLEHVVGRITQAIHRAWPTEVKQVKVQLAKLNPPFGGDVKAATVSYTQSFD